MCVCVYVCACVYFLANCEHSVDVRRIGHAFGGVTMRALLRTHAVECASRWPLFIGPRDPLRHLPICLILRRSLSLSAPGPNLPLMRGFFPFVIRRGIFRLLRDLPLCFRDKAGKDTTCDALVHLYSPGNGPSWSGSRKCSFWAEEFISILCLINKLHCILQDSVSEIFSSFKKTFFTWVGNKKLMLLRNQGLMVIGSACVPIAPFSSVGSYKNEGEGVFLPGLRIQEQRRWGSVPECIAVLASKEGASTSFSLEVEKRNFFSTFPLSWAVHPLRCTASILAFKRVWGAWNLPSHGPSPLPLPALLWKPLEL